MSEDVLPCGPEAASQARKIVARACTSAELGADSRDSALLCTSELVTNAIVHGRSDVRLTVTAHLGRLRIEVGDDNSRHPQLQPVDDGALDGRGLFIVDLLASRWGVRDDDIGKVVWFELVDPGAQDRSAALASEAGGLAPGGPGPDVPPPADGGARPDGPPSPHQPEARRREPCPTGGSAHAL